MVLGHKLGIQKNKRFTDFNTYFVQKYQKKKHFPIHWKAKSFVP